MLFVNINLFAKIIYCIIISLNAIHASGREIKKFVRSTVNIVWIVVGLPAVCICYRESYS